MRGIQLYFLVWVTTNLLSISPGVASGGDDEILVKLEGKILDASTLEPIAAKLTYKIKPSGRVTGIRMFDNNNGAYVVQLQQHHTYTIEVSSEDYQPLEIELRTDGNAQIENDFHLHKIPSKGEVFELSNKIYFDRGAYTISEESLPSLQALAEIMRDHPKMRIRLEGHTDRGSLKSLFNLSENRVREVKDYMVEVMGIDKKRIKLKAFGGSRPITTEESAEARQKNRRVEVRVIQL